MRVVEFGFYFKILNMVEKKQTAVFPAIIYKMIELEFSKMVWVSVWSGMLLAYKDMLLSFF